MSKMAAFALALAVWTFFSEIVSDEEDANLHLKGFPFTYGFSQEPPKSSLDFLEHAPVSSWGKAEDKFDVA